MEDQINSLDPSARQTSEIFQSYAVYIQILIASLKECYELGNLAWGSPAHMRFVSMAEHMLEMIRSRCASIIFAAQGIIQISPDMFPWQASSGGTLL
ncbi:hypothetical protein EV182_008875 [Spiromyces aspiralis]|uniref:Uncharacterized protein n=1 Tax=Spiromyces aspiralis TaxID=68401 RepID=A0ACC1HL34_9FUNG|nr:hypothetical protein EV182_008875 [Spiromyces aspiralis]